MSGQFAKMFAMSYCDKHGIVWKNPLLSVKDAGWCKRRRGWLFCKKLVRQDGELMALMTIHETVIVLCTKLTLRCMADPRGTYR